MTKEVKYSNEKPPIWDKLVEKFNPDWNTVVVTYGDTIHFKEGTTRLPRDLVIHECVHIRQQTEDGMTPEAWWDQYLTDYVFRANQEIEAYQAQWKFLKKVYKDKNDLARELHRLVSDLSSEKYGKVLSYADAKMAITEEY